MYGFTNDKSNWNLGSWSQVKITRQEFTPGVASEDYFVQTKFPTKYIGEIEVEDAALLQVLGESQKPTLLWGLINGVIMNGNGELTESQSEDALKISTVFFQNEKIYVVMNQLPDDDMYFIFKGA